METMTEETKLETNPSIHPDVLYSAPQVASFLGLHPDSVYRIPRSLLERTPVGPRGGRTKFWGRDVLKYLNHRAA